MKTFFLVMLLWFVQIPESSYATVDCNNMQSISMIWSCPNGGQAFFSIITDGCHVLIRFDGCDGNYTDFYYSHYNPKLPRTGNRVADDLFNTVLMDFETVAKKSERTDFDVKDFQKSAISKIREKILVKNEKGEMVPVKGNVQTNSANSKEIADFNGHVEQSRKEEKKDVKKDDK